MSRIEEGWDDGLQAFVNVSHVVREDDRCGAVVSLSDEDDGHEERFQVEVLRA